MAILSKLLTEGSKEGAKKALKKATKDTVKDALSDAVSKTSSKAISKSLRNEITDEVTDAAIKKMPRNLTGAGVSSLEKNAGSTLDGILGRSSGITLKNAKKKSLKELTGYKSLGNALEGLDMTVDDLGKGTYKGLSRRNLATVKESTREAADMLRSALEEQTGGLTKSQLPKLNRQQYYEDTLGKLSNRGGTMKYEDVPDYMKGHLVNANRGGEFNAINNDEVLRELFGENMDLNDAYAKYEDIASSDMDANKVYTPENIDWGLGMQGKAKANAIEQDFADRLAGAREIPVEKITSGKKNVKVSRPVANSGLDVPVDTDKAGLVNKLADMKAELQTATGGGGMKGGGGTPTATASPDYGGLGDSGFANKLNEQVNRPVNVQVRADGSSGTATKQQQGQRYIRDKAIKGLNATPRQYADLMGKSRSIGNYYEKVADRINAENIVQANVAQKTEAALNHIENIKARAFETADELGLTIDLSGIDNTIGLKPYQKKQLTELGYNLNDIIGDKALSATQAEEVYRIIKGYAYDLMDDSAKPLEKAAGKELNKVADEVSKRIDDVLDNMGIDFKKEFLDGAGIGGADMNGTYLREISQNGKPLSFSDLRREESDWINISKTAGRPIKEDKVPESIAEAVGQAFKRGGEKIKEKYYERQAYGAGGAGAGAGGGAGTPGGTGVPPTGTEGPINFETVGGQPSKLRGLLAKGKDAGLVGAGVLGGLMLGGNGGGQPTAGGQTLADVLQGNQMQRQQSQLGSMAGEGYGTDPYAGMTVGGYTYNELADGYARALQAGDASAAESIAKLMGIIEDKATATLNRQKYESSLKSSTNNNSASAVNVLSQLYDLYNNIKGGTGPIVGDITNALNAVTGGGYNTEANTYWQVSRGSLGKLIRGMGDSGALSEGDQKRALQMIPNITDTREAAEQKFMALYNILSSAAQM